MKSKKLSEVIIKTFKSNGFVLSEPDVLLDSDYIIERSGEKFRSSMLTFDREDGKTMCLRPDLTVASCISFLQKKTSPKIYYSGQAYRRSDNKNSDFWFLENFKNTTFAEPSGIACDQWNRYEEDIKMMADHSIQSYRMSLEWAKIEPEEGIYSNEAIDHYRKVLECCRKNNLKTCVTYQHFTSPLWFTAKGGWEKNENVKHFI